MKLLLIDAGNSKIKLAWVENGEMSSVTQFPVRQVGDLSYYVAGQGDVQVWVSNVAGSEVGDQIGAVCALHCWTPRFIIAQSWQGGVSNTYTQPAQLGSDRWAALIAAWHQLGRSCLVVVSGTATTIDALSDNGEFMGGLILPGIELMQRSLTGATAQLQLEGGNSLDFPRNTADAVWSGAVQASCGAIRHQHALLGTNAPVLLSGGAAHRLSACCGLQVEVIDNLVLKGLLLIAEEAGKS